MAQTLRQLRTILNTALDVIEEERLSTSWPEYGLEAKGHPCDDMSTIASSRLYQARRAALAAVAQIKASIQPAQEQVLENTMSGYDMASLYTLARTGVFAVLASQGAAQGMHVRDIVLRLSEDQKLNPDKLSRLLRLLSANHWVTEISTNVFKPTRLALSLVSEASAGSFERSSLSWWIESIVKNCFISTRSAYENWTDPLTRDSESPDTAPWCRGAETKLTFWEKLAQDPCDVAAFAAAMTGYGETSVAACLADYDWAALGESTVVDVGGGRGSFSLPLVRAFPNLSVILQDRPETVPEAEKYFLQTEPEIVKSGRANFQVQDFFEPNQQVGENLTYIFRWILHDWSDALATEILSNIASVMHESSRILIIESIVKPGEVSDQRSDPEEFAAALRTSNKNVKGFQPLPAPAPLSSNYGAAEKALLQVDCAMDLWFSSKERNLAELDIIVRGAGLQIAQVHPTRSYHWIVEVVKPVREVQKAETARLLHTDLWPRQIEVSVDPIKQVARL